MKKTSIFLLLILLLLSNVLSAQETEVSMPKGDGATKTVAVSEPITFYDAGGADGNIPKGEISMITFEPKAGELIEITFESIDLQGSSQIRVYDGLKALDSYYDDYDEEYVYSVPSGQKVALSGTKTNEVITSESQDGKLSVCFSGPYSATGTGWKATVKSIPRPAVIPELATGDVLMSKSYKIYIIENPVNFYDDRGKNGKISSKFEGTITFVPSTTGKKIKIDFSKLEIFNTSSTGYNDVFKFYNGQTVDEANLIETLLKEAKIVKSTADDGSITVSLKSTTGVPANGWEAVVSEFTPGPMTVESLNVSQLSTETVAGENSNEQFLLLNVNTSNTQTPLALQSINVDATGTTNILGLNKVKVYFLGRTSTFSTTTLFGETTVSAENFSIAGNQELKEGDNYFALVYDLTSAASNEDIIAAKINNVNISGAEQAPTETLVANRTVANVFKSQAGNHTRTFHDTWTYTDTKSTINPTYYDFEDKDCYITFTPSVSGSVAEIDFSAFDVTYSSSAYTGVRAVFEIYSGTEAKEENLLWKLNDNAQSKTGPQKKLRSVAADGSITIKFNAKTTSSYYAGKGWTATVTPFINHNMTVEKVDAFQENTDNLKAGDLKQEIIGFTVKTEGDLSTQKVKEVKLNIKNSESVIDKVEVYYSADKKDFSQAVLFGSISDLSSQEVTATGEQALTEGINYFWVAYDIKSIVQTDVQVDAQLVSIKTEDAAPYTPVNGDPAGYRLTKNEYLLASGDNGQVTIHNPILFYDNGGASGEYSLNLDGRVTFLPSEAGKVVKVTFDLFQTAYNHYFYVYNGTEVNEDNLIGKYSSSTYPESLFSQSADGALTVRFVSTTGYTYDGWQIKVESYTTQDLSVESISTSAVTTSEVLRGSSKAPIQKIEVKVAGDKGNMTLNNFKFENTGTTDASEISSAKLYYTNTSSAFIPENQVGAQSTSAPYSFTFDEEIKITEPGTYYFWLTYDISSTATSGNKVAASLNKLSVNGTANTAITALSSAERNIKEGFKGTYTIGKSETADYSTFASAIAAMQGGVEGAVKFNIEAGTYTENIRIKGIQGTSDAHNIVFTSATGNNEDVIITGSGYSEPAYGDQKYGMVAIDSTEYVTFENISFVPTSQSYPYAVHVLFTSRHFTLRNCVVTAEPIVSGYSGMSLLRMEARSAEGNNNDYITIENNTFYGGYIALYMGGTSTVALTKERGAIIRNNTITNAGSKGIYLSDEQDALIDNNTVINSTTQKTGYQALDIFRNRGSLVISNNKIVNNQAYYSTGIYLRQELMGTADVPALVYNNSVALTASPSTSSRGIEIVNNCAYVSFYNNTINISGTSAYAFSTASGTGIKGVLLQNNLIQNNTSSPVFFLHSGTPADALSFKNNVYYTAGTKFANLNGDDFATWQTNKGDVGSFVEQAVFVSSSDLRPKSAGGLNAGIPIDFITKDANGKERSLTNPTVGAYEYELIVEAKPELEEGYPKTGSITYNSIEFKTKWNQTGTLYGMIKKATEEASSESDLLALTGVSVNSGQEYVSKFTALEEETDYKAYFIFVSALNVNSDIATTNSVTTLKQIFPLAVTLPEEQTVTSGSNVEIVPTVSGSVYPYAYEWKNQMNDVISTDSVLNVSPTVAQQYKLTVTTADNQTGEFFYNVLVTGASVIATFEDNYLAPESYWQGRDTESMTSVFYSGSYSFTNTYSEEYSFWGGFGYANLTTTDFDPAEMLTQQFRSAVGHGAANSNTYSIVYAMGAETKISVVNNPAGAVIPGVYLTNAAYTINSMKYGDSFAGDPFAEGDYYKVIFTGTTATRSTSTVEYYLADYRSANTADHYMLEDWKWFDLSSLGNVTSVTISVAGSRTGDYGLNTPAYLCMDNLGATAPAPVGIDFDKSSGLKIYPVPATDVLNIATSEVNYTARIYNLQGQLIKAQSNLSGNAQLDVSTLSGGNYLLEIVSAQGKQIKNFIKR